jgi:hypothetical protein
VAVVCSLCGISGSAKGGSCAWCGGRLVAVEAVPATAGPAGAVSGGRAPGAAGAERPDPRREGVPLRYTDRYRARFRRQVAAAVVVLPPAGGLMSVTSGEDTFGVGLLIGVVLTVVVVTFALAMHHRLGVRAVSGTMLIGDTEDIDLARVDRVELKVVHRIATPSRLMLRLGSFALWIGDPGTPCFLAPEGLRALASAVEKASHEDARTVAERLRLLADDPRVESWPSPE